MSKSWQVGVTWGVLIVGLAWVMLAQPTQFGLAWALSGLAVMIIAAARLNLARSGRLLPRTGMEAPWLAFSGGAALAAGYSFAQPQAALQATRILAGFFLFCALAEAEEREIRSAAWISLLGAGVAAMTWILTHDFTSPSVKFTSINRIGQAINSAFAVIPHYNISGNVAGGVLAGVAPIGAALVYPGWGKKRRIQAFAAGFLTLLALAGLLFTSSRGAMLGVAAGTTLSLLALAQLRWAPNLPAKAIFWLAAAAMMILTLVGLVTGGNLERLAGAVPDPTGSLQSRVQIWRQGVILVQDYFFTGAGLSTFPLVYSIYSLLIHVPFHEHMHNIFLETWFEQGAAGVIAMLWGMVVVAGWVWRSLSAPAASRFDLQRRALGWAGVVGLTAMGVHGLLDVIFYLKPTMPLVGLIAAFAAQLAPVRDERVTSARTVFWRRRALVGGMAVVSMGLVFSRPLLALGYANLGALFQTRAEMRVYNSERFDNPTLDQVRREVNLAPVMGYFEKALENQPGNRTALERLAEIALSRGEYRRALEMMEKAWGVGYRDEATRLLLSDAWLANGSPEKAVEYLAGISQAEGRVWFQAWYRYWLEEDYRRAMDAWRAVLLIDPRAEDALYWIEQAKQRISP